ncbi:hypothetical protein AVEN_229731-1 [Araneus ventricosus]|uniref:Uncharacterized protein n=1 Tax=Araneus ventricosus TaxID=182803 RepID=A0A4Y2V3E8_ARAVE|nr:hypothetical protein AVEN_229731-1 [Araneus ventricosus]
MKNLTICSMSAGPETDIIGLLCSLHLINKPLVNSAVFKVISRHSSWSNVVNEMINSSIISVPDASTLNFTARNFLKDLSKKSQNYLKAANILLMCDSLSSSLTPEKMISQALERVIQLLKPGTSSAKKSQLTSKNWTVLAPFCVGQSK